MSLRFGGLQLEDGDYLYLWAAEKGVVVLSVEDSQQYTRHYRMTAKKARGLALQFLLMADLSEGRKTPGPKHKTKKRR